jgi:hypothetical protein
MQQHLNLIIFCIIQNYSYLIYINWLQFKYPFQLAMILLIMVIMSSFLFG